MGEHNTQATPATTAIHQSAFKLNGLCSMWHHARQVISERCELTANDGRTFQSGCSVGDPEPNPTRSAALTRAKQIQNLLDYRDELNVARMADNFLCGNVVWEQGDIESDNGTNRVIRTNYVNVTKVDEVTWEYGISTPGEGWSGFDCSTPICELSTATTVSLRPTLFTVDELKVEAFRTDPCGTEGGRWGKEIVNGALVGQGNCTLPMNCTCLCRVRYDKQRCANTGELCEKPWHDPFGRSIPPGYVYGTRDCVDGFQGLEDAHGNFQTCHLQVYVPSFWRRYTVSVVAILTVLGILLLLAWYYIRKKVRRALLLAKAERRRSRKNSEDNILKPGAFTHLKNE
ncbi:hypothetical protein BBJ29_004833 [Phytophthora kernoviae]|uniref:Uncharacterized protein n=1 Tax=Phytophthora kernoviae TaxID=325452 RepID=A0A3F2RIQ7_9STRA|nr:hypothetical protein BBJ29_004833 [Phytophthora kernoviae]RLN58025.1 hypothetical protein BBP00_00007220 [Phytophthora kernoviae]